MSAPEIWRVVDRLRARMDAVEVRLWRVEDGR